MVPNAAIAPSFLSDFLICVTNGKFVDAFSVEFIFSVDVVISRGDVVVFTIVDDNVLIDVGFFPVDVVIFLVVAVVLSVKYSVVNGNIVVDVVIVIFLVDVAGSVDVNCLVVIGSFLVNVVVVSVTNIDGSSSVDVKCFVVSGSFVVFFSSDIVMSFVDGKCSVGIGNFDVDNVISSVDVNSPIDDNCSVVFCNFVVDEAISSLNVVTSSVDVNFSVVSGKTVANLIIFSVDVNGFSVVISIVDNSSVDDVVVSAYVVIPSDVVVDGDVDNNNGENVLCGIVVNCSSSRVVMNSTVVSGKVFVVFVVHKDFSSLVVVQVTISE